MKLEKIDKQRYRKHLNIVIGFCIVALILLSLSVSQSAIWLFTDRQGTHFWLNLTGVAVALFITGTVLNRFKQHDFMREVYYVWRLKQQINFIHRKHAALEKAIQDNDVTAITIMTFYFAACRQLYELDDNTITLSTLNKQANELAQKVESLNLNTTPSDYQQDDLKSF